MTLSGTWTITGRNLFSQDSSSWRYKCPSEQNMYSLILFCLLYMNSHNIDIVFVILLSRRPWHLCTSTFIFISPHTKKQESIWLGLNLWLLCDFWVMPTVVPYTNCFPGGPPERFQWISFSEIKELFHFLSPHFLEYIYVYCVYFHLCVHMGPCKWLIVKTVCLIICDSCERVCS